MGGADGYISFGRVCVLVIWTAIEESGNYGAAFEVVQMVLEVAGLNGISREEGDTGSHIAVRTVYVVCSAPRKEFASQLWHRTLSTSPDYFCGKNEYIRFTTDVSLKWSL